MSWVVAALIGSGRTEVAIKKAIDLADKCPYSWEARDALGRALAARREYRSAVEAFQVSAALRYPPERATLPAAHYLLHSSEQLDYIGRSAALYPEFVDMKSDPRCSVNDKQMVGVEAKTGVPVESAGKVYPSAPLSLSLFIPRETTIERPLNAALDFGIISSRFMENGARFVIIDELLSPEALESLRRFCLGARVWRRSYEPGYVGAFPEDGFASVLLFEIADALREAMPGVLEGYRLAQWWALAYDQHLSGTDVHADDADISVNLWITQTEANLQLDRGGLIMWDRTAPETWKFQDYNGDSNKVRLWLAEAGAREMIIPHRANRAVVFNGRLFHCSDGTNFAPGYENRRRNITFLFHRA
jgi:hypothetical protein